jgi:chemotaxis protein MotA
MLGEIVKWGNTARRGGLLALEPAIAQLDDDYTRKGLQMLVDGAEPSVLRASLELDIDTYEDFHRQAAKVWESAGGYAPTIGIIGAVLGLIQVMKHLENIEEVGRGIAVAFVATVYGVASANLFFLPAANKIKARFHHALEIKELMLEGVCSIVEGLNPKLIRVKLDAFTQGEAESPKKAETAQKPAAQTAAAEG